MTKNIFFRSYGNGFPLLIFHGFLGNSDQWIETGKHLSSHFKVIIPDLPNHGNSFHTENLKTEEIVRFLYDFVEELNVEKMIVLGHSWGGKLAMKLVHDHPCKFSKLIVVDISPKAYSSNHTWEKLLQIFNELQNQHFRSFGELESFLKNSGLEPWERYLLIKNFERKEGAIHCKSNADILIRDFPEIQKEIPFAHPINIPTLFLKGELSNYISDEETISLKDKFPFVQLKTVSHAGHSPHLENTAEFLKTLKDFLEA